MRVMLDQSLCDVSADTVGQAIDAVSQLARQRQRLIVEVLVDGRAWSPDEIEHAERRKASANEIHFVSSEPIPLIRQTLDDASAALKEADELQQAAASELQAGKTATAMAKLTQAFEIWASVQQAVEMSTAVRGIDLAALRLTGDSNTTAATLVRGLHEHLQHVRDALRRSDTVALADILLYDLPSVVHQWRGMLDDLQDQVRDAGQAGSPSTKES